MTSVIAIDLGASNFRVYRATLSDRIELTQLLKKSTPKIHQNGFERWDVRQIIATLQDILKDQRKYESVSVCGWGVDFCLLDETAQLIENPLTYRDPSHQIAYELTNSYTIFEKTGIQPWPFNTLCQLKARQIRKDSELDAAYTFMLIPDFIAKELACSNELFAESTNASTTQMLNLQGEWCESDIFIKMPTIRQPGYTLGNGFQLCASHDTASAFYSVTNGDIILSSGTWSLMGKTLQTPIISEQAFESKFTNERGNNNFRFLKNISGFWLLQQCFGNLTGNDYEKRVANSDKKIVFDVNHPSLLNPPDMKSAIKNLCDSDKMTDADLVSSIYASLVTAYLKCINELEELTQAKSERITMIGGGIHHRILIQELARQIGNKLEIGSDEATVLGNARFQFKSLGLLPETMN